MCKQFGIIYCENLIEFYDFTKAKAFLLPPKGKNMLIITSSGGSGILATDAAERNMLNVKDLDGNTAKLLKEKLPAHCVIGNHLDLTGDATAERFEIAAEIAMANADYDIIHLIFGDPIAGAVAVADKIEKEI